jgi:hypothetical protein
VVIRFLDSEGKGLWLALGEGTPKLNMLKGSTGRELWQKEEMSNN